MDILLTMSFDYNPIKLEIIKKLKNKNKNKTKKTQLLGKLKITQLLGKSSQIIFMIKLKW